MIKKADLRKVKGEKAKAALLFLAFNLNFERQEKVSGYCVALLVGSVKLSSMVSPPRLLYRAGRVPTTDQAQYRSGDSFVVVVVAAAAGKQCFPRFDSLFHHG